MDKNIVISISRKYGCGGRELAQILAEKLNIKLYDRKIVHIAAAKLETDDLNKNDLFDTSIPKKVNIQSSRSGDPYDGNPPASKEEQKERMKYIRSVYNKEYNDGNHDESIYTIYLYTSHYIENINYDKSFSDEKNFGHPVYANII